MYAITSSQIMGKAKQIEIKAITPALANDFVKNHHYSGKVAPNSQLHFGVYFDGKLHGALQFGPPLDKRKVIGLVHDTAWNGFLELNRMAFDEVLPRNSESRAISVCLRLIKKHAPHIKWILSFADATQCGTGTIYRASGFVLTQIKQNKNLRRNPQTGEIMTSVKAHHQRMQKEFLKWKPLAGYQLRYIYFLDLAYRAKLAVEPIPYSKLDGLSYPEGVTHHMRQ